MNHGNMHKRLPIVLTATIRPHRTTGIYAINQTEEDRFISYQHSIKWISDTRATDKLILAENSSSKLTSELFKYLHSLASPHFHTETLHYPIADEATVKGKGYGEGWLISKCVRHSRLLSDSNAFIKITGRYQVKNFFRLSRPLASSVLSNLGYQFICQDLKFYNFHIPIVSTALFACTRSAWLEHFEDAYLFVDDIQGWAFEAEIADRLKAIVARGVRVGEVKLPLIIDSFNTKDNQPFLKRRALCYLTFRSKVAYSIGKSIKMKTLCLNDFSPQRPNPAIH
ncbi:hypothetical protein [Cyanobium sp. BA5m-10]|uniref:hypothetical protein n=2 Tax=unclassified Cyanobium TaxID=2627006 RepID=UPI0020CFB05B|nr:hypothetical protein [Cyanobium sp. BA5m-10]